PTCLSHAVRGHRPGRPGPRPARFPRPGRGGGLGLARARGVVTAGRFAPNPAHREIVFLTGSGISARTGLGTFRGQDGLWALEPETEEAMHADLLPGSLPRLWRVWGGMARVAGAHCPTPGHRGRARARGTGTQCNNA